MLQQIIGAAANAHTKTMLLPYRIHILFFSQYLVPFPATNVVAVVKFVDFNPVVNVSSNVSSYIICDHSWI